MKNIKVNKKLLALVMASSIGLASTGCSETEQQYDTYEEPTVEYDVLNTNEKEETKKEASSLEEVESMGDEEYTVEEDSIFNGVEQTLDVKGEKFKLQIDYSTPEETWKITDTKELHMEINTLNLPSNKEVYIDNIHTDTSIVSSKEKLNGILQDTMDDHIHNSQMMGFPISDTNSYYGINEIEGQNDQFIKGFCIAGLGYATQKRLEESDYLSNGVWANRTDSIIDLIIVDKNTGETRTVSVSSTLLTEVYNKVIECYNSNSTEEIYYEYQYDHDGSRKMVRKLKRER